MTDEEKCPIWGTPASTYQDSRDGLLVDSPRTGGKYFISRTAMVNLRGESDAIKTRVTTWLVDQRQLSNERPEILTYTIEQIKMRQPLPVLERVDRMLKYLAQECPGIGSSVQFHIGDDQDPIVQKMLAWTESINPSKELYFLLTSLSERQWTEKKEFLSRTGTPVITIAGYIRLAELATKHIISSQGFVAMWFPDNKNEDYDLINRAFTKGIYPGIDQAGYKPFRVDRDEHNDQITDKIISEIKRSKFLVADFTHGDSGVRGGVYYEAGFAHGLNIPVIYTCLIERFSTDRIHFDISHQNFILWETPEDLREKLKNRITGSEIGWGPNNPQKA